jgi:large subunit ribosomal protein L34e
MVERQTLRRHVPWNTKSNKHRMVKTPGGRLVYQHVKKTSKQPKCGDTGRKLIGMPRVRPTEMKRLKQRQRTVARAYGGVLSAKAVKTRIVRAFLIEEQRCVKEVLIQKEKMMKDEDDEEAAPKKEAPKKKKPVTSDAATAAAEDAAAAPKKKKAAKK